MLEKLKSKPIIFSLVVYFIWEIIGIGVSLALQILFPNIYEIEFGNFIFMLLNEIITFIIVFILFCRKQKYYISDKQSLNIFLLFPVVIQIGSDIATLLNGEVVINLFSLKGVLFLVLCFVGTISVALLEETVWRYIIFGNLINKWKGKKYGILLSVLISSILFGLSHYMNLLTGGQEFIATSIQVVMSICMGIFLASIYYKTSNFLYPLFAHGLCNFSNFFMNEMLGYNYELLKYDTIIQILFTVLYLVIGLFIVKQTQNV